MALKIEGYQLVKKLGEGGMAAVFLAEQRSLKRAVAIKVLKQQREPEDLERFMREAQLIAQLDHPAIVGIHDFGQTGDGLPYFVMPYLAFGDLRALKWSDDRDVAAKLAQLCRGLQYAHERGVVHRDIKPQNILLNQHGQALLADFGIAFAAQTDKRITREGSTIGSVYYMSPEQARGLDVDGRSDLYSLGVVMFEGIAGQVPFDAADDLAVLLAHVNDPVPRVPEARRSWQPIIERCMAKAPANRYAGAAELAEDLERLAQGKSLQRRRLVRPLIKRLSRPKIAAALVTVAAGAMIIAWLAGGEAEPPGSRSEALAPVPREPVIAETGSGQIRENEPVDGTDTLVAEKGVPHTDRPLEATTPVPVARSPDEPATETPGLEGVDKDPASRLVGIPDEFEPDFWISAREVTVSEYRTFAQATRRAPADCSGSSEVPSAFRDFSWQSPGFTQTDEHPVVCVSWNDAHAYAQWLAGQETRAWALPTVAQWREAAQPPDAATVACESGNVLGQETGLGAIGRKFSCSDGYEKTAPVGRFLPNALGVYDLRGNVKEWTADCAARARRVERLLDRVGVGDADRCDRRMARGTAWSDGRKEAMRTEAGAYQTDRGYTDVGIRLVVVKPPSSAESKP